VGVNATPASINLADDGDAATVSVSPTTNAAEPGTNGRFTVDLGQLNSTGAPITVNYTVTGTAANGTDYTIPASVQIAAGSQTAFIDVTVLDDALVEGTETVIVTLTSTGTAGVGVNATPASINLADDDNPPVINDATVALAENTPNGTSVVDVDDAGNDTDADGDPLTYSITGGNALGGFAISPATGVITVANSAVLDFETNPSFVLTVQADDGNGNTDTATITINLTNVNEVPVNTMPPGPLGATEDTTFAIAGLSITDPDGGIIDVTLSVTNGVLTVNLAGGATISAGANGSGALTLSGTVAQLNAALTSLGYQGLANYFGPDTLTVTSDDGALSDTDAVAITVAAVNDAPMLGSNSFTINAGVPLVLSGGNLSATDIDTAAATLVFSVGSVTNGFFLVSGVQSTTFTQAQLLAGQVQFVNSGAGAPGFTIFVSDGGASIGPIAANIVFNGGGGGFAPPPPTSTPPSPTVTPPLSNPSAVVPTANAPGPGFTASLRGPTSPRDGGEGETKVESLEMQVAQPPTGVLKTDRVFVPNTGLPSVRAQADTLDTRPQRAEIQVEPLRAEIQKAPLPLDEEDRQHIEVVLTSVRITGLAVSVGAVWWAARAAGLVASLLSATPAWRHVDPLPVLGRDEDEREQWDEVEEQDQEKKDEEHRAAWVLEGREAGS
jgi:hypothetical protein